MSRLKYMLAFASSGLLLMGSAAQADSIDEALQQIAQEDGTVGTNAVYDFNDDSLTNAFVDDAGAEGPSDGDSRITDRSLSAFKNDITYFQGVFEVESISRNFIVDTGSAGDAFEVTGTQLMQNIDLHDQQSVNIDADPGDETVAELTSNLTVEIREEPQPPTDANVQANAAEGDFDDGSLFARLQLNNYRLNVTFDDSASGESFISASLPFPQTFDITGGSILDADSSVPSPTFSLASASINPTSDDENWSYSDTAVFEVRGAVVPNRLGVVGGAAMLTLLGGAYWVRYQQHRTAAV